MDPRGQNVTYKGKTWMVLAVKRDQTKVLLSHHISEAKGYKHSWVLVDEICGLKALMRSAS